MDLDCRRARVLVVEDERVIARDLANVLEDLGYDVVGIADTAQDAIREAEESRPDVVLMDIRIRGADDGIAAALALRSRVDAPVVFLSANADPATLARALASGPGGYLTKPVDERSLQATLEVALSRSRVERELRTRADASEKLVERLREESTVDALTGLHNRRHFDTAMRRELSALERGWEPLSVILLDIDHFKSVNDRFGHAAGDLVLRRVAAVLRQQLRAHDEPCRYGGEEFVVLLPGTPLEGARVVAERIRRAIETIRFADGDPDVGGLTASFGVAAASRPDAAQVVEAADRALYRAKAHGRNRVAVHCAEERAA